MDAVQRLRSKAEQAGHLQSGPQQMVGFDNGFITIQPADPQLIYVPAYDPALVYGSWWNPGISFDVGVVGVPLWGGFDWRRHEAVVDVAQFNEVNRTHISDSRWHRDATHSANVPSPVPRERQRAPDVHAMQRDEAKRAFEFPAWRAAEPSLNARPHR